MSRRDHYQHQHGAGVSRWPIYTDGDVRIVLTGSRQYQLHSTIMKLMCHNGKIQELLDDDYAATLSSKAIKRGAVIRYHLNGVDNTEPSESNGDGSNKNSVPVVLEPVALDTDGKPLHGQLAPLDLENGLIPPPVYDAYDTVFGALYQREVDLGDFDSGTITEIIPTVLEVVQVAEYLGMVHSITKPVEVCLLSKGQLLQRAIAGMPSHWLVLACRLQSRAIFREALIHGVGQINTQSMKDAMKHDFSQELNAVITNKANMIRDGVQTATLKMLSYYPPQLARELTNGYAALDNIGRNSYSNDIFLWMALTAFRQFIAINVNSDSTHNAHDLGCDFMKKIQAGDYLTKNDLDGFYRSFPMTDKGKSVMERWLAESREAVKKQSARLLKNESQLDVSRFGTGYFTHTTVNFEDYPFGAKD